MKLISREWLDRAKDDLDVVEAIIGRGDLTNMVAFHSQQAVEKTYKALIEEFEIDFKRPTSWKSSTNRSGHFLN